MSLSFDPSKLSRVTLRENPNYERSGMKSYAYALNKYNITPTINGPFSKANRVLVKRREDGQTSELTAEDIQWNARYLAEVGIGTPRQNLLLELDTGSSDLWCWSSRLPAALQMKAGRLHSMFNPDTSSTWIDLHGESFEIWYGDHSHVKGNVGEDTLTIGGLIIEGQTIETATTVSEHYQHADGDGVLGLAFGTINAVQSNQQTTLVDNMAQAIIIPEDCRLFTAHLGLWSDENGPDNNQSFYTFGYIDQEAVNATGQDIHYVDVDPSDGFWRFPSSSVKVNSAVIDQPNNTAIADTGTVLALVSDEVCRAIYDTIPGAFEHFRAGGWVFPIETPIDKRPTVQFSIRDKYFVVDKEDLGFADIGNGYAYGSIQSRGDFPFDILGHTFLKAVYAIFDRGNQRFGCVQRVDLTQKTDMIGHLSSGFTQPTIFESMAKNESDSDMISQPTDEGFTLTIPVHIVEDVNLLVEDILLLGMLGFFDKARPLSDESIDEYCDIFPFVAERMRLLWDQSDFDALLNLTDRSLKRYSLYLGHYQPQPDFWRKHGELDAQTRTLWSYRSLAALATGKILRDELHATLSNEQDPLNKFPYLMSLHGNALGPDQIASYVPLNYLKFCTRTLGPADIKTLPRIIEQLLQRKQFWAAECLVRLLVLRSESCAQDCTAITKDLRDMSSDRDVYENLGEHGVWLCLCESLLYRGVADGQPFSYIEDMTKNYWRILEQQLKATALSDTASEPESELESKAMDGTADTRRGLAEAPTGTSGTDSQRYTRSKLRWELIVIDVTVGSPGFNAYLAREAIRRLEDIYSRAVANHDNLLMRTIQWRLDTLNSEYSGRGYLMQTDLVPESLYQRAQDT